MNVKFSMHRFNARLVGHCPGSIVLWFSVYIVYHILLLFNNAGFLRNGACLFNEDIVVYQTSWSVVFV